MMALFDSRVFLLDRRESHILEFNGLLAQTTTKIIGRTLLWEYPPFFVCNLLVSFCHNERTLTYIYLENVTNSQNINVYIYPIY